MTDRFTCDACGRESTTAELRDSSYRCMCGEDQFSFAIRSPEDVERWGEVPGVTISSHLFLTWSRIAVDAARRSRDAALDASSDLEFGASLMACTASSFAIDAFYGDVRRVTKLQLLDRVPGTRRHQVVREGLKSAFDLGPVAARTAKDLKWLYGQRNDAVHFKGGSARPVRHHSGAITSAEVAKWSFPSALRALDLLTNLLGACLLLPRPVGRLPVWVGSVKPAFVGMEIEWAAIRALWTGDLDE